MNEEHRSPRRPLGERGSEESLGGRAVSGKKGGAAVDNGIKGLIMVGSQDEIHRRIGKKLPENVSEWTNSGEIYTNGKWRNVDDMLRSSLGEFMKVYRGPKPGREDIIEDGVLMGMIREHETRCSYLTIEKYVTQIKDEGETAVEKILELLRFDYHLRPFVSEKLGLKLEEMDLFFGRPLVQTITMFRLQVIREPDGSFFLTIM